MNADELQGMVDEAAAEFERELERSSNEDETEASVERPLAAARVEIKSKP